MSTLGTTLLQQLTENLGAGEEITFSKERVGLVVRRRHGDRSLAQVIDPVQLRTTVLPDEYLGERLWDMAVRLRGS